MKASFKKIGKSHNVSNKALKKAKIRAKLARKLDKIDRNA